MRPRGLDSAAALTLFLLLIFGAIVAPLVVAPGLADAIGGSVGVDGPWIMVWSVGRWVSFGALLAIVTWALATVVFALYVTNVGTYDRVYGSLGGGLTLLELGAEVDAEVMCLRQLRAGIAAEKVVQLPMRDTTLNLMLAQQHSQDVVDGRSIRAQSAADRRDSD